MNGEHDNLEGQSSRDLLISAVQNLRDFRYEFHDYKNDQEKRCQVHAKDLKDLKVTVDSHEEIKNNVFGGAKLVGWIGGGGGVMLIAAFQLLEHLAHRR